MPVVVVKELRLPTVYDDFRQWNEETGNAVENENQQIKYCPEFPDTGTFFLQKIQHKVVISNWQHHHAQQRYMMPEVDRWPKLHTHAERAAVPENHDGQQCNERVDYFI